MLVLFALIGLVGAFDLSTVAAIVVLVLGFLLVAFTTTGLGTLTFKALGVEIKAGRTGSKTSS